jgi:hypothetical protein
VSWATAAHCANRLLELRNAGGDEALGLLDRSSRPRHRPTWTRRLVIKRLCTCALPGLRPSADRAHSLACRSSPSLRSSAVRDCLSLRRVGLPLPRLRRRPGHNRYVHKRPRPYRPQINGKVTRFHRTLATGWAYTCPYSCKNTRRRALPKWLHLYNHHRHHTAPHSAGYHPPPASPTSPVSTPCQPARLGCPRLAA